MKSIIKTPVILLVAFVASVAFGKDFKLPVLKQAARPTFDLTRLSGQTFFEVVESKIAPAMEKAGSGGASNEQKLRSGAGVSVRLVDEIYNIHINYPQAPTGGRSYGWNKGSVGDWSDHMYLEKIAEVMDEGNEAEIRSFYTTVINMLGNSNASGLSRLSFDTQRVATNFLAIYTAEAYRRIQDGKTRWDDALTQVTLLAAFHGGQPEFKMFYTGEFTGTTKEKGPGVYANGRPGSLASDANDKEADMTDYHQFSRKTPDQEGSNRSGINLTRKDFEKLGTEITRAESSNANLRKIQAIVGKTSNVYSAIAAYFAEGKANADETADLARAVGDFMVDTHKKASTISTRID